MSHNVVLDGEKCVLKNAVSIGGNLIIQNVRWKDRTNDAEWAGTYQCVAENILGKSFSRNVTVSSAFIRKNFLQDPAEDDDALEIVEGNKLELECLAPKGHPVKGKQIFYF